MLSYEHFLVSVTFTNFLRLPVNLNFPLSPFPKTTTTKLEVYMCVCAFFRKNSCEDTCSSEHCNNICASMCVSACTHACMCEHLSICACLCDMMCMMCGSEAYLPPSYIICILVTACPLGVRFTDAYCVPLAALVFMESHCYGEVHVWVLLFWQTDITQTQRE